MVDHNTTLASDPAAKWVVAEVDRDAAGRQASLDRSSASGWSGAAADGRTGIVTAGAAAGTNAMVVAAEHLSGPICSIWVPR